MHRQLQDLFKKRVDYYVNYSRESESVYPKAEKKKETLAKREAEIVKVKANGKINAESAAGDYRTVKYSVHFQYLIKQKNKLYIEEEIEERLGRLYKGELIFDDEINPFHAENPLKEEALSFAGEGGERGERGAYQYNRMKAVQYAERWWNSHNPAYKKFDVDCTSFISQCLHEGGAPMSGFPNRQKGWWLRQQNYSYSWAVANSLRLYLGNAQSGLQAKEVFDPMELLLGDVICYDFQGDGRFDHNTIVTGKDANGMPLVNAHTYNSRMRYWAYEDSSAYTPNIRYKFFSILGGD